jgi:hypothetical protein
MKIGLRRIAMASALVVAVAAAGVVPGAAASERADAGEAVATAARLHDELAQAVRAGDLPAMRWSLRELTPLLTDLAQGERYALADSDQQAVATTTAEATSVKHQIETMLPERLDLPSVPSLLNMLLQQLLQVLMDLINSLLGGGISLPIPPIP